MGKVIFNFQPHIESSAVPPLSSSLLIIAVFVTEVYFDLDTSAIGFYDTVDTIAVGKIARSDIG